MSFVSEHDISRIQLRFSFVWHGSQTDITICIPTAYIMSYKRIVHIQLLLVVFSICQNCALRPSQPVNINQTLSHGMVFLTLFEIIFPNAGVQPLTIVFSVKFHTFDVCFNAVWMTIISWLSDCPYLSNNVASQFWKVENNAKFSVTKENWSPMNSSPRERSFTFWQRQITSQNPRRF